VTEGLTSRRRSGMLDWGSSRKLYAAQRKPLSSRKGMCIYVMIIHVQLVSML